MKRFIVVTVLMAVCLSTSAQESIASDSVGDNRWSFNVGLAGGVTLMTNGNDVSPYYSRYGVAVQVPVTFDYKIARQWKMSVGLRYDFNWTPLEHRVAIRRTTNLGSNGIDFDTTASRGSCRAMAFHNYLGIPVSMKWYPFAKDRNVLSIGVDVFAGYALGRSIVVKNNYVSRRSDDVEKWSTKEKTDKNDPALVPWKVEVGLTISTDVIGLIHGIRLSANLLPTYKDPVTGEKIYTMGMTFFL